MNSAIIVAGGNGSRIGGDIPKQFIKIEGKEILSFSVDLFNNHTQIEEVIIVVHVEWMEHVKKNYPNSKVVTGGETRQKSVKNGLAKCSSQTTHVLIHDAARPLISSKIITSCINALENADAVAPIMDSSNSLVEWDGREANYTDRDKIKEVQTPQCFKKEVIQKALDMEIEATDEIGLVLKSKVSHKIDFVHGSHENIKITYKKDVDNLQFYFQNQL